MALNNLARLPGLPQDPLLGGTPPVAPGLAGAPPDATEAAPEVNTPPPVVDKQGQVKTAPSPSVSTTSQEPVDLSAMQKQKALLPKELEAALGPPPGFPGSKLEGPITPPPEFVPKEPSATDTKGVLGGLPLSVTNPEMAAPPPPPPSPLEGVIGSVDQQTSGTPGFKPKMTGLEKFFTGLKIAGAIGGGMEAAGNPLHAPQGAQMLERTEQAAKQRELEQQRIQQVEAPLAKAHADYFSAFNPTKLAVQQSKNEGGLENTALKNYGAMQVAALRAGAPMVVDPHMAELAGQPQLAGQMLSGPSLQNFIKVLNARGISIKDLGDEGLWSIDRYGNRIKQVTVNSPSLEKASAYARARAEYTPVDVYDTNGQLRSESQLDQLRQGVPTAAHVFAQQGPTNQTRNMSQMAATIQPHLDTLRAEIQQLSPYLGPLMGRGEVNFLAGKVGSTGNPVLDQQLGRLMSDFKLASSAVGRTHFAGRTGLPASQYFEQLFNAKRTPEELMGVLDSIPDYIEGYVNMTNFTPQQGASAPPVGGSTPPAAKPTKAAPKKGGAPNPPAAKTGGFFSNIKGATPVNGSTAE